MTIAIRQLQTHFVGEVSGLDLRKPLTGTRRARSRPPWTNMRCCVFHDQDINDEQQMAFALNFGQREDARGGTVTKEKDYRLQSGLNDVSNLGKDGKPLAKDSRAHLFNLGNCLWHSDSSFRPIPAKFSLLSARVVNPKGGNTEFADMRAAYDALDDETKAEIERSRLRALADVFAGIARLHRIHRRREGDVQAGAAAAGADPSGASPQVAVSLIACRQDRQHERAGGTAVAARSQRARDATQNSSTSTNGSCMTS